MKGLHCLLFIMVIQSKVMWEASEQSKIMSALSAFSSIYDQITVCVIVQGSVESSHYFGFSKCHPTVSRERAGDPVHQLNSNAHLVYEIKKCVHVNKYKIAAWTQLAEDGRYWKWSTGRWCSVLTAICCDIMWKRVGSVIPYEGVIQYFICPEPVCVTVDRSCQFRSEGSVRLRYKKTHTCYLWCYPHYTSAVCGAQSSLE